MTAVLHVQFRVKVAEGLDSQSGTVVRQCLIRSVPPGADFDFVVGQCLFPDENSAC